MSSNLQRNLTLSLALCLLGGTLANPASAQNRYKWRDSAGRTQYSDTLTQEALTVGYDIVNAQGLTVKRVPRLLSPEEKAAAAKVAAAAKAAADAAAEQKRRDQQLLAAYPEESDLIGAQHAHLEQLTQIVRAAHAGMQTQEVTLADFLSRADELQHRGNAVPKRLTEQIAEMRAQLDKQRAFLASKQEERDRTEIKQRELLDHYRKLKQEVAKP